MTKKKNKVSAFEESKQYIVGIGASAGGLEAIHELFDNMPADTSFCFVIIQHLSPDYKSLMPELLAKHTQMQIFEAQEDMLVHRNCIYVIPSKKIMTIQNGRLRLTEKTKSNLPNTAIDSFFKSLANEKKESAIGIILSGTGTDGTKGIEAIKQNGGVVLVQDPLTAKFDGMPNSAIATGFADLILPPEMMAQELSDFLQESPLTKAFNEIHQKDEAVVNTILDLVQKITGRDFRHYKRPTLYRRLVKRMAQKNISTITDYLQYLRHNSEEVKDLCNEFLIGVTKFFRDTEAFEDLKVQVVIPTFEKETDGRNIKVWVVACSTGEEAYSLAFLYHDHIEKHSLQNVNIKIFATDIDSAALETASKGIYPATIENDVSATHLEKYFTKEGNKYKVIPNVRRMIVFAHHDVLSDPPFSRVDFISCRNMLIYMLPELQKKVLKTFHFALNTGGFLMLGPSENISVLKESMKETSKKWKIFKNIEKAKTLDHEQFFSPLQTGLSSGASASVPKSKNALMNLAEIFKDTVVEEYHYAGIYIDRELEVKQAIGNFKSFLNFPQSNFNFNLLKLIVPDLAIALGTCVRKAIKDNERVSMAHVKIRDANNVVKSINIVVKPYLQQTAYLQPFLFIVLREEQVKVRALNMGAPTNEGTQYRTEELEQELKETRENLQSVVEELETSNEELQSSNEEMISANEELQSTNEELQSLNEELHTVNAEHQQKIKELIELNDDLNNYFRNTEIGQLLIDKKYIIRKFTPATKKLVNLIEADLGRSITDISTNFPASNFINQIKQVIKTGETFEKEIIINNGNVYQMRIVPYIKLDKTIGGAVITFIDITELKQLSSIIEGVFESSLNGILAFKAIRNTDNQVVDFEWLASNNSANKFIGAEGKLKGKKLLTEFPAFNKKLFAQYVAVVESGTTLHLEYPHSLRSSWYEIVAVKMGDGLVVTFSDITDKKNSFEDLKSTSDKLITSNSELEKSNYDLMQFASVASHDLKEPLRKIQTYGNLLNAKMSSKLKDNEKNYLEKIVKSSERMQVLIDDVLTFSKLSNKNTYFTNTDINHVIERIIDDLEIIIREKQVKFFIQVLPKVFAIPGQMSQLFQNLISNAIKFNNSTHPEIRISCADITAEEENAFKINRDDYVGICVQDNGIGFEEKFKDKVFGIFQRLHNSNDYEGTGIGLAICKKIVENHHGAISVTSVPNEGTVFKILLPVKMPDFLLQRVE